MRGFNTGWWEEGVDTAFTSNYEHQILLPFFFDRQTDGQASFLKESGEWDGGVVVEHLANMSSSNEVALELL